MTHSIRLVRGSIRVGQRIGVKGMGRCRVIHSVHFRLKNRPYSKVEVVRESYSRQMPGPRYARISPIRETVFRFRISGQTRGDE